MKLATDLRTFVSADGVMVEVYDQGRVLESYLLANVMSPSPTPTLEDLATVVKAAEFELPSLKPVCMAQWILESGRGTSTLFRAHNNAGGMKWRKEMEGYATPVEYQAHDGMDTYCKFASLEAWVRGYWRFIERSPYAGWREAAKGGAKSYISFLKVSGYAEDPDYVNKVMALIPEAEKLLGMISVPKLPRVLLDPGHSERESGARSNDDTAEEEDLNRIQAQEIAKILHGKVKVDIYDPEIDDLDDIGSKAAGYDAFVSLHHNSYSGSEDPGTEVLYSAKNAKFSSIELAKTVANRISQGLGSKNRGSKSQGLRVLSVAETVCNGPCILIESYFLNKYAKETAEKRSKDAAKIIAEAIHSWAREQE